MKGEEKTVLDHLRDFIYAPWTKNETFVLKTRALTAHPERHFIFQSETGTIRVMPENYLIASDNGICWKMDPDLAAPWSMVLVCTLELMEHDNKYGDGDHLLAVLKKWDDYDVKVIRSRIY